MGGTPQLLLLLRISGSCCCFCCAWADVFNLNDRNYPHVFINDPVAVPVIWHKKGFGFRLTKSAAVRINARGIRFIPGSHSLVLPMPTTTTTTATKKAAATDADGIVRQAAKLWWNNTMTDEEIHTQEDALDPGKWRSITCTASRDCLCTLVSSSSSNNNNNNNAPTPVVKSRFLPNHPLPVYLSQRDATLLPVDVARMFGVSGRCPEASTGRTAIAPQHASNVQQHDISLCNIVGLGSDYVYVPHRSRLFVLAAPVGNETLVLMSVFIVYLMIVMGHNLQMVLGVRNNNNNSSADPLSQQQNLHAARGEARWAVASMGGLLLLSFFSTSSSAAAAFVTVQDQVAFFCLAAYVTYYCVRIEANVYLGDGRRSNPVNPMLASIVLAVQRVYGSVENPYSQTLIFIMLTWLLHKMSMIFWRSSFFDEQQQQQPLLLLPTPTSMMQHRRPSSPWHAQVMWWRSLDALIDSLLLSVLLYAGVMGQEEVEPSISAILVLQAILAAIALNRALTSIHFAGLRMKHDVSLKR